MTPDTALRLAAASEEQLRAALAAVLDASEAMSAFAQMADRPTAGVPVDVIHERVGMALAS